MTTDLLRLGTAIADRYSVVRQIGAGGMATVFLARDLRHDRDVAIKVLHPELGATIGGERFLREIRTTARLQHPHILPLLDSGEADGLLFYVMPFVDGETLRTRLERERQLPIAEAIRIAREVASALDYAHRHGVIHRDIKPENILLHDGQAIVADFGIALAVQAASSERMTQTGLSLGTPQYMSPEQAMGDRTIDARTDVYALGAVTYEMLTGDPPFTGSTVQAIVARVMTDNPSPIRTTRDRVPPHVEAAVLTALAKLPADRFDGAKAFADALQDAQSSGTYGTSHAVATAARPAMDLRALRGLVAGSAIMALAGVGAAAWGWSRGRNDVSEPVVPLTLETPDNEPDLGRFTVSANGSRFAFANTDGVVVRDSGQSEYRLLPGTSEAESPTFSSDGTWIAYQAHGRLRKISLGGGSPLPVIANDSILSGRVSWGPRGTLVFETGGHLALVSPDGSLRRLRKATDAQEPRFTPDERGVLYVNQQRGSRLMYYDLAQDSAYVVLEDAASAELLPNGYLVYGSVSGGLYAVQFNERRHVASGTPIPVVRDLQSNGGVAPFAVTATGTLVYRSGLDPEGRLVMRDPSGKTDTLPLAPKVISYVRFSPDGSQVALTIGSARGPNRYTAIYDLQRGTLTRFTNDGGGHAPVWSPDGSMLAFTAEGPDTDAEDIFVQPVDRSRPPRRMPRVPHDQHATAWPSDTLLVFTNNAPPRSLGSLVRRGSVGVVNPIAPSGVSQYLDAEWGESDAAISPDGQWAAFTSLESGKSEIRVRRFPRAAAGGEWKISTDGGERPRWSGDGRTIFHMSTDNKTIHAVQVAPGERFSVGADRVVVNAPALGGTWDVDRRTGRILLVMPEAAPKVRIVVMQHWLAQFERTVRSSGAQ